MEGKAHNMYQNRKVERTSKRFMLLCKASNEIVLSKKLDFAESGKLIILSATANRAL